MCLKISVDEKFSKSFKSYFGRDAAYTFISNMIEESKYCSDFIKRSFDTELVIFKTDSEDFRKFAEYWIWDNAYVDCDAEERAHFNITAKNSTFRLQDQC